MKTLQVAQTIKGTSTLEVKKGIENFEVIFVNDNLRQAKSKVLVVAPNANWFVNQKAQFELQDAMSIMDGTKKDTYRADWDEIVTVKTSIGLIEVNRSSAKLI